MMARKLQIKRGLKKDMPTLAEGELGFAIDEKSVYIGTGTENIPVGQGGVIVSATNPPYNNVLWIDTANGGVAKYHDGTAWVNVAATWG